jgi:hypothetical protein
MATAAPPHHLPSKTAESKMAKVCSVTGMGVHGRGSFIWADRAIKPAAAKVSPILAHIFKALRRLKTS